MKDHSKRHPKTGADESERQKVIDALKAVIGRPASFGDLCRAMGVGRDRRNRFRSLIGSMLKEGRIIKIRGGRIGVAESMNLSTGELICHADGYGFLRPSDEGEDIFIGPRKLGGAMHGDTVVARIEGQRGRGKKEGRVIRVVKRAHKKVVGRFVRRDGVSYVVPTDERILERVAIPSGSAKDAEDGLMVEAEITSWPEKHSGAVGKVIDVIGDPGDPDIEAEVILREYGLPSSFPREVLAEANDAPRTVGHNDIRHRVDLRQRPTFTIDGETAKDFDDAVSIEKTRNGYRLFVSIADVAHYVHEGGAVDREAYKRGTSVYFPGRCTPMLPVNLSNGICSLNPDEDRLTLTAELEFDEDGSPTKKRIYESVIRSSHRLTYTTVRDMLGNLHHDQEARHKGIMPDVRLMEALAERLNRQRIEAGSIDFDLPEPQIIIDMEGNIEDIVRSERNVAHRIIEEFMLAANRAVAEEFGGPSLPFLYRVHPEPKKDSISDFIEFTKAIGVPFKPGLGHKAFQAVLNEVKGRPEEKLVNHILLRSMQQAYYSENNTGHFGLAFKDYTHFTSPIRRYPDLVVHRLIKGLLHKRLAERDAEKARERLHEIAVHSSAMERKAIEAERDIVDLKKAQFMKDKVGDTFDGFISGVASFGFFVELKDYFVEGLVHASTLADDFYRFDERTHSLIGVNRKKVFRLGDGLGVKVSAVDVERRRIDLVLKDGATPKTHEAKRRKRPRR